MLSCSAMLPVEAFIECLFLRLSEIFVKRSVFIWASDFIA